MTWSQARGAALRGRRAELRIESADLARRVGVSRQTLHRWEGGGDGSTRVLDRLCQELDLSPLDLMRRAAELMGGEL